MDNLVEKERPVYWAALFNGDNRETIARWLLSRNEKIEIIYESDGNLAVPVTFLADGRPENRIFEKVYPGEYVMVCSTGGIVVVDGKAFFDKYGPYTGNQYENYGGKMSLIEIPVQLKVPEVSWCVKYDGTKARALSEWVSEKTLGAMRLVLSEDEPPKLDYAGEDLAGGMVKELTPGAWLVASPESGCKIVDEAQLLQEYSLVAGAYTINWKDPSNV